MNSGPELRLSPPILLESHHDTSRFDCGKPALNEWLKKHALSNQRNGFTRVIVVLSADRITGVYGLAPTEVLPASLPRSVRTGQHPAHVPAILIGQLAVDKSFAGHGLGSALLRHALERAVAAARIIGGRVVVVRAIDREAEIYWQSNDFIPMRENASMLFRSIQAIEAWMESVAKS